MSMTAECLKVYNLKINSAGEIIGSTKEPQNDDAAVELDRLVHVYMSQHNEASYRAALEQVLNDPSNEALTRQYNASVRVGPRSEVTTSNTPHTGDDASAKIDRLARAFMAKTGEENYSNAINHVLQEDARLRAEYQACVGSHK